MNLKELLGEEYTKELEIICTRLLNEMFDKEKDSKRGLYIGFNSKNYDASQLLEKIGLIKYNEGEYYLTEEGKKLFERPKIPSNYKVYKPNLKIIGRLKLEK